MANLWQAAALVAGVPLAGIGVWALSRVAAWNRGVWARETKMFSDKPFPLAGRPDLVRWESDLSLTVADLKNRRRPVAERSDVIQLSCYAALVRRKAWWKVNGHGIVIVQTPDGRRHEIRVELLDEAELTSIRNRWDAILSGRATPDKCDGRLCRSCDFRGKECDGA